MDIRVENHGSIVLFFPESGKGKNWLRANIEEQAIQWAGAVVCEPRYVADIIQGAREDGLEVA